MSQFSDKFDERIKGFWEENDEATNHLLLEEILGYANLNPQTFEKEINSVRFDKLSSPLPIILEALSKDTETWGKFYVDLLDDIFKTAKGAKNPNEILNYLQEFAYIENDVKPFVGEIVDKITQELKSEKLELKLAAICMLPNFLNNNSIKNRDSIITSLQVLLQDSNWKVRVVTFKSLGYENLLPLGYKLSFTDKILKLILGEPEQI